MHSPLLTNPFPQRSTYTPNDSTGHHISPPDMKAYMSKFLSGGDKSEAKPAKEATATDTPATGIPANKTPTTGIPDSKTPTTGIASTETPATGIPTAAETTPLPATEDIEGGGSFLDTEDS